MRRQILGTGAMVLTASVVLAVARMTSGYQFASAQAAENASPSAATAAVVAPDLPETLHHSAPLPSIDAFSISTTPPTTPVSEPAPATSAPTARPVLPTPVSVQPTPAPTAPTVATCQAGGWFCYPRLGIAGAIVPYVDCSGKTDVGTQIRSFSCLSDHYLMGHAYTQFGKITSWKVGDTVIAYGQTFTVTGAFVQSACTQPRLPLAPLEMQTSLTPNACGDVLVVQAN